MTGRSLRPLFDHATSAEPDNSVGDRRHGWVMGGDYNGELQIGTQLVKKRDELLRAARVEIAGGFICQQQLRLAQERTRNTDPLTLASGKSRWRVIHS